MTISEYSSCNNATRVVDIGSTARGNCKARTSPRFWVIARDPETSDVWQKEKKNTPTVRKAM